MGARENHDTAKICGKSVNNQLLKQLENTIQIDDICAQYINRKSTLNMIAPNDQLNSADEHIKTQESLEHKAFAQ